MKVEKKIIYSHLLKVNNKIHKFYYKILIKLKRKDKMKKSNRFNKIKIQKLKTQTEKKRIKKVLDKIKKKVHLDMIKTKIWK